MCVKRDANMEGGTRKKIIRKGTGKGEGEMYLKYEETGIMEGGTSGVRGRGTIGRRERI